MFLSYGEVVSEKAGLKVQFTGAKRPDVASAVVSDDMAPDVSKHVGKEVACYSKDDGRGQQVVVSLIPR